MSMPMEWAFKIAAIHPPVEGTWKAEFCREWMEGIAHFVGAACAEAVEAKREACAKVAEDFIPESEFDMGEPDYYDINGCSVDPRGDIAQAIRTS